MEIKLSIRKQGRNGFEVRGVESVPDLRKQELSPMQGMLSSLFSKIDDQYLTKHRNS